MLLEADRKLALRLHLCWYVFWQCHTTTKPVLKHLEQTQCLLCSDSPRWSCEVSICPLRPAFLLSYIVPAPKRCSGSPVSGRIVSEGSFVFSRCFFFFFQPPTTGSPMDEPDFCPVTFIWSATPSWGMHREKKDLKRWLHCGSQLLCLMNGSIWIFISLPCNLESLLCYPNLYGMSLKINIV